MNQVPHITKLLNELENIATADWKKWDTPNATANDFVTWAQSRATHTYNEVKAEIALAEQSQEQYITAEDARKLGAGKAEFKSKVYPYDWLTCDENCCYDSDFKYRAIKQPEPAEPHAELKAMYEQQVRNGTTEFYLWEFLYLKTNEWRVIPVDEPPLFINPVQYRCTPKPTCQIRNLDSGVTETMTREAAKLLQAETKDMCDWFMPNKTEIGLHYEPVFKADGIYTYKLRKKDTSELTQARLKEVLHYDVYTGIFTWLISSGRAKPNKPAGTDSGKGYTQIWIDGKSHYAHRLAWLYVTGDWPKEQIDHINGNRSDNSFRNLRQATHAENLMNIGMTKTNTSGYKGVSWSKRHSKWYAQIRLNNKVQSLGHFDDIVDAANAYKKADLSRGEFSRQNSERKANLVKLDGEFMTRESAIALWESKKDTCDVWYTNYGQEFYMVDINGFVSHSEAHRPEYQLRPKPLKQVSWKDVPVGVMTNGGEFRGITTDNYLIIEQLKVKKVSNYREITGVELAPADQQPWIAVQDDDPHTMHGKEKWLATHGILIEVHDSEEKYRITGLASGYGYPEQKGEC